MFNVCIVLDSFVNSLLRMSLPTALLSNSMSPETASADAGTSIVESRIDLEIKRSTNLEFNASNELNVMYVIASTSIGADKSAFNTIRASSMLINSALLMSKVDPTS